MSAETTPKVTVYTTAYNYGLYLQQSIESVLRQTLQDWELIVIDDASTDETATVLTRYEEHPRIRVVRNQTNKGLVACANMALGMARGEYIVRLDADDFFDENALLVLSTTLDRQPEAGLVYPDYYHVDAKGDVIELVRRKKLHEEVHLLDLPAHGAGTMIRRRCLEELHGYREIVRCQDGYDLWIRFIDRFGVANVNLPLFYYRRHGQNLTENTDQLLRARRLIKRSYVKERFGNAMPKVLGIIPVRGKNTPHGPFALRDLGGKQLLAYTIEEAQAAEVFDRIILVTEDTDIARYAIEAKMDVILRPENLARANVPIEPTVWFTLGKLAEKQYVPDIVTLMHVSSPLKKAEHICEAVDTLLIFKTDSVVTVCEDRMFHYQHRATGLTPLYEKRQLRLEKSALYSENGAVYVSRRETITNDSFVGGTIGHVVMPEECSVQIDREYDFWLAEKLLERTATGVQATTIR
jgi:CMP-N-acetylneuraminic acid synthetase